MQHRETVDNLVRNDKVLDIIGNTSSKRVFSLPA